MIRTNRQDEVLEGEIDACGDEGGRDDDAADLDVEAGVTPWVVVEHDAPNVAEGFA